MTATPSPASFRDPHGFVFHRDNTVWRQVNAAGRRNYDLLIASGLYQALTDDASLVTHEEVDVPAARPQVAYRILRPSLIPFISYPYEWSFTQFKQAALLTLAIQRTAMRHGMSLRDATPYNVQFDAGRPVWIDTLSFEQLTEGRPWVAYRQFCELFLAPLAVMAHVDVRLQQLLRSFIDGIPLEMASRLLPAATRLKPGLMMHVHLHAAAKRRVQTGSDSNRRRGGLSMNALNGLIDSLERTVRGLDWRPKPTTWSRYYQAPPYTDTAFEHKRETVAWAIDQVRPSVVWDLGANDGTFSRLASDAGIFTIAFDNDPLAVDDNYRRVLANGERNLLPLVLDLTNPSSGYGWADKERTALHDRGPADLGVALALVHHLAITHNVPLALVASYFARLCRHLLIEFVPREDGQVKQMLATREDIFESYTQTQFESTFGECFTILRVVPLRESSRTLYLMRRLAP